MVGGKRQIFAPSAEKKKRKSASQRQMFAFFPPTTSRFSVWTQLLGKKRASANQSLFFQIIAGQQLLVGGKKANICISQLTFYSSASFLNYHPRPVWKKKSQMVEARGRRVSQEGGDEGAFPTNGAPAVANPLHLSLPLKCDGMLVRTLCRPSRRLPAWPLITIGL